jgi:hypothetical protein
MPRILHVLDHSLPLHSGYTFRSRAILKAQTAAGWDVAGITGARQYQHNETVGLAVEQVEGLIFHRTMMEASGISPVRECHHRASFQMAVRSASCPFPGAERLGGDACIRTTWRSIDL